MSLSSELAAAIEEQDLSADKRPNVLVPQGDDPITLTQRMLSACSGSVLTSLLVTPFDVVRIRLQQQVLLAPPVDCCRREVFWKHPNASNPVASCATTEVPCSTKPLGRTVSALFTIGRNEGFATLWRGLSLTLLMAAPANIIYFTGYELLRDSSPIAHMTWLNPLLCGSIARSIAGTCIAPLELLKTRLQSIPSAERKLASLVDDLRIDVAQKGPRVLFRGLALTLWRDVPFSGIYWSSYEYFKHMLASNPSWHFTQSNDTNLFLHSFISGSISGSIAAFATNPFDVGKTRLQISSESKSTGFKEKKLAKFMSDIVKYEGVGALYVGLIPRLLKVAPSCAIMISSYELGKKFFSSSS